MWTPKNKKHFQVVVIQECNRIKAETKYYQLAV